MDNSSPKVQVETNPIVIENKFNKQFTKENE